jgi:hypothetical protein
MTREASQRVGAARFGACTPEAFDGKQLIEPKVRVPAQDHELTSAEIANRVVRYPYPPCPATYSFDLK